MSTLAWKKIVFEGNVPNIGNTDLTIPALESRNLKIGGASKYFNIQGADNNYLLQATQPLVYLGNQNSCVLSGFFTTETQLFCNATNKSISCEDVDDFTIESHNDEATAGPILNLVRDPDTPGGVDNDELARINFQGDDSNGIGVSYSDITSKIIDPDDENKNSDLIFRVRDNNIAQSNLVITSSSSSSNALTSNEGLLKALKIQTKTLEELTRRNLLTFQCGFSEGQIMSANNGNLAQLALKTSGAVQMSASTTLTNAHGIVMPFGGFIAGGSFSAERPSNDTSTAVSGNISLFVRKVFPSAGTSHQDIRVASRNGSVPSKPKSDEYPINNTNHRTTGDTGVQFNAGDILIPFFQIDPDDEDTIRLQDLIAQVFVYTESIVA